MLNKIIKFFLENKLVTVLTLGAFITWGIITSPFNWDIGFLPNDPVPVDAIPDLGENQQIVYTQWPGRSPQDIEDQISYPLTTALLGIPGVRTIRSNSIFGVSSIYIIFEEGIEFYWGRTRILEKLNSLPSGTLPAEVTPALGPDATALGQVYWYTLEGRDKDGNPAGGWDPQELRTIQDFYVSYSLTAAKGVAEVASIGGFVKEYQIDIDPNAMKAYGVNVSQIMNAVKKSNLDIGARTIEFNRAEYLIRALGYIKNLEDLEKSVVTVRNNVPVRLKDVADIHYGPATRRGGLDKGGAEAVGGVVVARYGANPLEVIENVKAAIAKITPGLPTKTLPDGTISRIRIIPFYDRTGLIKETLGTLESALSHEILISIIVVMILVLNLRASLLISSLLPIGVLITFITMRQFGVDANIVALSGIAIAIGVMVDVGIVFTENIVRHIEMPENKGAHGRQLLTVIYDATVEVASAVITALTTTVFSFLPVFAMQAAEGKLFRPLAFTKTFAMLSALFIGIVMIPAFAHIIFNIRFDKKRVSRISNLTLISAGLIFIIGFGSWVSIALIAFGINNLLENRWPENKKQYVNYINVTIALLVIVYFLTVEWLPLGAQNSTFVNFLFVTIIITVVLGLLMSIVHFYPVILKWILNNKWKFLIIPILVILLGITTWQGFDRIFGVIPAGFDNEENLEVIRILDKRINSIPEVESVVGKWGRVNSALDPAPVSMYENLINYRSEYMLNEEGHRMRFKVDDKDAFMLNNGSTYNPKEEGFRVINKEELIEDKNGEYFRQWRDHIKSSDDIWKNILAESKVPGLTSAPKLQPIQTRLVMLQTGMRAPMGIKVFGPDLETIEKVGYQIESLLKEVPGVQPASVFADRVVGKPYIEIDINRDAISRYGLTIKDFQTVLSSAIGGMALTMTVEGRERFPVRVRYAREYRDSPDDLKTILIPTPSGVQVPLGELAEITYTRGPQLIKSEDTFLVGYVIFDKKENFAEVDVVEDAQKLFNEKMENGEFMLPAGVSYVFTGNYENQIRATKRLLLVVPISLLMIFLILYFQFHSVATSSMVFSGIFVAFAGGFIMIWLYSQGWFMNFSFAGINMRDLFQMHTINLSVAVWVGFIALFGIATDDGVIMGTYLTQVFDKEKPKTVEQIRESVLHAGSKRVRPAMMTASTAIIALIPVLSSVGKGSDIMIPMAIPSFGGMLLQVMTMFVVPVLFSMNKEKQLKKAKKLKLTSLETNR
ncbi:MAG: cation transporter [Bacteroidetes bacterium 4572_114]|nr:MAG: cation transporter [Bacteroidetes bacterium 4572_114]